MHNASKTAPPSGRGRTMGLACAAGGTALWGISFVAPVFMPGISAWDVSLGRYLVFGLIGLAGLGGLKSSGVRISRSDWLAAFSLSITGYYGCYTVLVHAIALVGPALPTLVMGLTPITVAVAGALRTRDGSLARLAWPLAAVVAGLAAVNLARHGHGLSTANLGAGLAWSFAALALLTYYLVANLLFLKTRPHLSPMVWANVVGVVLLGVSFAAFGVRLCLTWELPWQGTPTTPERYLACCLVLGLGASWLGGVLWNKANALLPSALVGQCIVFWPVSGVVLACLVEGQLPRVFEALGMVMVFAGVWWGVKATAAPARPPVGQARKSV